MKRLTLFLSVLWLASSGFGVNRATAQVVAPSVPFATATTSNAPDTAFKIPHGAFIPFFAKTEEPTVFDISDEDKKYVSLITLPRGSAFGGVQFNTPGVQGYNFPDAKSDITIILGNNNSSTTRRIVVATWKNPSVKDGPALKPVKSGVLYLDILPVSNIDVQPKPVDDDIVVPKPVPKPDNLVYSGKALLCVLEETSNASAQRGQFFASKELRQFLSTKLAEHPKVVDKDHVPNDLKAYYQLYLDSKSTLPYYFLIAATAEGAIQPGTILKQGNIPSTMTPAQFMEVLK
jgi:hypothetical protein